MGFTKVKDKVEAECLKKTLSEQANIQRHNYHEISEFEKQTNF